jgi:hypothetical protein
LQDAPVGHLWCSCGCQAYHPENTYNKQSLGKEPSLVSNACNPDISVGINNTADLKVHNLIVELVARSATTEDILHQVKQRCKHNNWTDELTQDHICDCRASPTGSLREHTPVERTVSKKKMIALLHGYAEFHAALQAARLAGTNMYLYAGVCAVSVRGNERRFGAPLHKGMCSNGGGKVFSEDMAHATAYAVETMFSNSCLIEDPPAHFVGQPEPGGCGGV